jgi:hypothetical protein
VKEIHKATKKKEQVSERIKQLNCIEYNQDIRQQQTNINTASNGRREHTYVIILHRRTLVNQANLISLNPLRLSQLLTQLEEEHRERKERGKTG